MDRARYDHSVDYSLSQRSRDDQLRALAEASSSGRNWPEIAVFGEWNTTNLGDRAIHQGVLDFFTDCGWRVSSYGFGSLTPVAPAPVHSAVTTERGRLRKLLDKLPPVKRALREVRQRAQMRALLPSLERAQAIMVGGGALFTDAGLHFPQSLAVLAEAAGRLDKPLLCLGCSTDGDAPWSVGGERAIRKFLAACSLIVARDYVTAEECARVLGRPVSVFGDFALGEVEPRREHQTPRHVLAINVQGLGTRYAAKQREYEDALVAVANGLMRIGIVRGAQKIRIFTTGSPEDVAPAQRVFARLAGDGAELDMPNSLERLLTGLRESALVVASRLHAGALALAEGAPAVSLSPNPKAHNLFATLGLEDYTFYLENTAQLIDRVTSTGCGAMAAKQRDSVAQSRIWAAREQVRSELRLLAGMSGGCK
jgi:polysaccharide pyruvyl transferase WcaK-like protein